MEYANMMQFTLVTTIQTFTSLRPLWQNNNIPSHNSFWYCECSI